MFPLLSLWFSSPRRLAALLVYDITDRDSFNRVKNWVKELHKFVQRDIVLVIAANKQDLARNQQISAEESQEYAKSIKAGHFKTSAKAGKGVEQVFLHISRNLVAAQSAARQNTGTPGGGAKAPKRRSVIISDEKETSTSQSSCC